MNGMRERYECFSHTSLVWLSGCLDKAHWLFGFHVRALTSACLPTPSRHPCGSSAPR